VKGFYCDVGKKKTAIASVTCQGCESQSIESGVSQSSGGRFNVEGEDRVRIVASLGGRRNEKVLTF